MSAATAPRRVPVIALTGYLGAGKTTLLNHLLRTPGARLGVVVNDFGAVNIDAGLVTGQVDEVASIAGGCVCCLPGAGGLDGALETLSQPRLRLDAILVEASGVADPVALARLVRGSAAARTRAAGLIDVVDASQYETTVDTRPEPPLRFAAATLVVLGKLDLVPDDARAAAAARITARIRQRNPGVMIVAATRGAIDPALVLDVDSPLDADDELPIARLLREADDDGHDHAHDHAQSVAVHTDTAVAPGPLVDLLEQPPQGAYRVKGTVRVAGPRGGRGWLVEAVGPQIHVAPLPRVPERSDLVAIGMHLDTTATRRALDAVIGVGDTPRSTDYARLERYARLSR